MTYLQFHIVFILPPILLLGWWVARTPPHGIAARRLREAIPFTAAIAFTYTIPWDNFLVYEGIWYYGPDRVVGTIGYVPVEEYLFFILQPVLTGLWTYFLLRHPRSPVATSGTVLMVRLVGFGVFIAITAFGALCLQQAPTRYLGLILAWAAPVLAALWIWKGPVLWHMRRLVLAAVAVPTVYLWVADRVAIGLEIWTIAPETSTGIMLVGLPVEEAVFFLVTNLLCVFSVLIFLNIWTVYPLPAKTA